MSDPSSEHTAHHGAGAAESADNARPEGAFDYGVIGVSTAIVAVTVLLAIRYLGWPGERDGSHIKRTILEEKEAP